MEKKINLEKKIERQNQIEQGFFDGRFKSKFIPNKKKKQNKEWARKKVDEAN